MKQLFILLVWTFSIFQVKAQSIIYVDSANTSTANGSSWSTAYPDFQDALEAAQPGDQIWVSKGTYTPSKNINDVVPQWGSDKVFMMRKGVKIYGGFNASETALSQRNWRANKSILNGRQPNTSLHSRSVVLADSIDSTAALDGFYITGGAQGSTIPLYGVGIGGGVCLSFSNPNLSNLVIHHNTANCGGGIGMYKSHPLMVNLSIIQNDLGGGVFLDSSDAMLVNCLIAKNHSGSNGNGASGLFNRFSYPTLINVTITHNTAYHSGLKLALHNVGYPNNHGKLFIKNSIIDGKILSISPSSSFYFYNTDLQDAPSPWDTMVGVDGGGNIGAVMYYTDAAKDNFRVEHCNPSIDAGSNQYLLTDVLDLDYDGIVSEPLPIDLDGNPRVLSGTVDMGAYEGFSPIPSDTIEAELCLGSTLTINGTNIKSHGYHLFTFPRMDSCDRRVYYDVHSPVEPVIEVDTAARTLKASIDSATYQWYDCTNQFILPHNTNQVFSPWVTSSYSVIVTKDGCTDTSDCVTVSKIGLKEGPKDIQAHIYPNPSSGVYNIQLAPGLTATGISAFNTNGQMILNGVVNNSGETRIDLSGEPSGIYILKVFSDEAVGTFRLVKY